MKKILLIALLVLGCFEICYSHDIYDSSKGYLYVGGVAYYYAQPDEVRDRSLNNRIIRLDVRSNKVVDIYTTDKYIELFRLSPDGKYLAINEANSGNNIIIIDSGGKTVTTLKNTVGIFEWSPDGRYIAYITGKLTPESKEPFKSEGLWIYDTKRNEIEKISDYTIKMGFSQHDGKLHFGDKLENTPTRFYIYEFGAKKKDVTPCIGLVFSPNGQYFIRDASGEDDFGLYQSDGNKMIAWLRDVGNLGTIYWLTNDRVFNYFRTNSFVFDPFNKKVIHRFEGVVMGWNPDRKFIVTYKNNEAIIVESLTGKEVKRVRIRE